MRIARDLVHTGLVSDSLASAPPVQGSRASLAIKIVASLVLAGGFVWIFRHGKLPLLPDASAYAFLVWPYLLAQIATLSVVILLRTYRWRYLIDPIAPVPTRLMMGVSLVGFSFIAFAPFRMGELARPYLMARHSRVTFTQTAGTVAAERIIDGLVLSLMLLCSLLLSRPLANLPTRLGDLPLPVAAVPKAAYGALALFTCAFVAMGLFYWARDFSRRLTLATVGAFSPILASLLTDKIERIADGLKFLPSLSKVLPYLRYTLAYWGFSVLYTWFLLKSCSIDASLAEAGVLLGVLGLGILVPSGPGFFGGYQLAAYCGLAMFFPESEVLTKGSLYVFLSFATQHTFNLLGLVVGSALMRAESAAQRSGSR